MRGYDRIQHKKTKKPKEIGVERVGTEEKDTSGGGGVGRVDGGGVRRDRADT